MCADCGMRLYSRGSFVKKALDALHLLGYAVYPDRYLLFPGQKHNITLIESKNTLRPCL